MADQRDVAASLALLENALLVLKRRPRRNVPAPAERLDELAAMWRRPLPSSYRAFMMLTDGFTDRAREPTVVGLFSTREPVRRATFRANWSSQDAER